MFWEILAAVLLGVTAGTITGITPGVHINLMASILLSISPFLLPYVPALVLACGLIAMAITHSLADFIPSIFLGAPSDSSTFAVLPGHRLLLEGMGYEAVALTTVGGMLGLIALVLLTPFLLVAVAAFFALVRPYIGIILLGIIFYSLSLERERFGWSCVAFLLAGALGLLTLSLPGLKEPLLPLLSGLFGVSSLLNSLLHASPALPKQRVCLPTFRNWQVVRGVLAGTVSGALVGIFPALGPAQAGILARKVLRVTGDRTYLVALGAVSASSMLFGLITLFAIQKARNGAIAILSEMMKLQIEDFVLLACVAIIACGFAAVFTLLLSKFFSFNLHRINYRTLSLLIAGFVTCLTLWFSGLNGLVVLVTGTAIGLLTLSRKAPQHHLMGCLLVPVLTYYF